MNIHFEKANLTHKELIFSWLEEPHIKKNFGTIVKNIRMTF